MPARSQPMRSRPSFATLSTFLCHLVLRLVRRSLNSHLVASSNRVGWIFDDAVRRRQSRQDLDFRAKIAPDFDLLQGNLIVVSNDRYLWIEATKDQGGARYAQCVCVRWQFEMHFDE